MRPPVCRGVLHAARRRLHLDLAGRRCVRACVCSACLNDVSADRGRVVSLRWGRMQHGTHSLRGLDAHQTPASGDGAAAASRPASGDWRGRRRPAGRAETRHPPGGDGALAPHRLPERPALLLPARGLRGSKCCAWARHGPARPGPARPGPARFGRAGLCRNSPDFHGQVRGSQPFFLPEGQLGPGLRAAFPLPVSGVSFGLRRWFSTTYRWSQLRWL